jgi:1-deoxyxylulose-5-phosphate synthase
MKYGRLPGIAKDVSRIVQGGMMLNTKNEDKGFALLDAVFEVGCNTVDMAHVYGNGDCERVLGNWIVQRGLRDRIVILDKGAHHDGRGRRVTPNDIAADLGDSLERLQTDYIDLYMLHRDDETVPVGPIVEALNEHRDAGRIRAFGGSNWTAARLREANEYAENRGLTPLVASSPQFSLAEQLEEPWENCVTITGEANEADRDWYRTSRLPLFCWSSLAGGWFSGKMKRESGGKKKSLCMRCYGSEENWQRAERAQELGQERGLSMAQVALAYVLNQDFDVFPLVASYSREECEANAAALDVALSVEEMAWLDLRRDSLP